MTYNKEERAEDMEQERMEDNKLKTLKDFDRNVECLSGDVLNKLRAEAVKWVKELGTKHYQEDGYPEARINMKWIINFFNLTEEDLK